MYDPLMINPAMTLGGKQAAFAASNSGMSLKLTHVQFGMGMYDPKGTETALKKPVGSRITLAGGARPTQYQIRMLAAWREDLGGETPVTEIGYYAGNVLAFVWSNKEGEAAFIKTDGVPAVLFSDIAFESVPAGSVDITVDPAEQIALAALAAHESASNAHPQYVEHALFPDAQADMWMSVTGSANALVLTPPIDVKVPAYKTGQAFRFKAAYSSTGPVSANIAGLGAKAVVKTGGTVLAPGDLRVGAIYDLIYDGARFQLAGGVGGGQFYVEWPTVATANQTTFSGAYTPGSEMVFVNGDKLAKDKYTATDGQSYTLSTGVAAGALVTMVAFSTFAVADTYTKGEYQSFVATLGQAQDKGTKVADRWMNPNLVHAAITARTQSTLYETTAGALLVPGSFGAGATKLNATASIDSLTASGTYGWGTATTGRPVDGEAGEVIHMTGDTTAFATQLVTSHTSKRAWLRRKNNNSWSQVELFTSDNQLSIGTSPQSAREALELGNAAQATLTSNARDSTVGRVLRVGDFGLGTTDLVDLQLDMDTLTATGFYLVTASSTNAPMPGSTGMVIVMTNASKWTQQLFMPQGSTRMFQRASNNGVWTAWTESWSSSNLVKTSKNSDSTLGRMLQVGDFGIGSLDLATNNVVDDVDDVTLPNGTYGVNSQTVGSKPNTWGILQVVGRKNQPGTSARITQTFIETDAGYPREWKRAYKASTSSWSDWVEVWTGQNAQKTQSTTDTTAGRLVRVGDYGLGAQLSVIDANDAIVAGFYRLDGTYKNSPVANAPVWLLVQVFNSSVVQYASLAGTPTADLWIRKKVGATGVWGPWAEFSKVGDFGVGATTMAGIKNIDDQSLANGWYAVISATVGDKPASFGVLQVSGRNNFSGSGGRVAQTFFATDGVPRMWSRTYTGTGPDTAWSAWAESWTRANLQKTESVDDSTVGRMLKVGDFGIGSVAAVSLGANSLDDIAASGFYFGVKGTTPGVWPSGQAKCDLNSPVIIHAAANTSASQSQLLIDRDSNTFYYRGRASSAWKPWVKVATPEDITTALALVGLGLTGAANAIAGGTDLNKIVTSGSYGQSQNAQASLSLNYPIAKAGSLFVQNGGTAITTQLYQEYDTGRVWNRSRYNQTWSAWSMCWDTDTLAKTESATDTTAGRLLKVGDFGLGAQLAVTDANDAVLSGFYRLSSPYKNSPFQDKPSFLLVLAYDTNVVQYASVAGNTTADLWVRKKLWSTGAWGAWSEVVKVGDYGLGAVSLPYISDINDQSLGNGWYAVNPSVSGDRPDGGNYGVLLVSGRANKAGNGGRVAQTFFTTEGTAPRVWNRIFYGTTSLLTWSAWVESWTTGNLEKTESAWDATAGRMLKVGDFGLGSGGVPLNGTNIDNLFASGFYFGAKGTTPGTWPSGAKTCDLNYPLVIHVAAPQNTAAHGQYLMDRDTNTVYYRARTSSWKPWQKMATTGDITDALGAVGLGLTGVANAIPAGSNLNNYVTSGSFGQALNAQTSLDLNYPIAKAGTLFVQNGGTGITTQLYQEFSNGRTWNRSRYNDVWSTWSMCWDTDTLVKTSGDLDSTPGRMLKVGDYGIGLTKAPKTVIASEAEWAKPAGWSGFIDVAATKAKGVTVPTSVTGVMPTYGMWQILGRRDAQDGYTGVFTDYGTGRMWIGYQTVGGNPIIFKEVLSETNVSPFALTLLDDMNQAAAQATLGIPALINSLVYGITTKDISGKNNVTLTATEAAAGVLWFTGTLTGNVDVIVPLGQSKWTVYNRTSGDFGVRIKTASGIGQWVPQGMQADIVNGGTNCYFGANAFPEGKFNGPLTVESTNGLRLIDSGRKYGTIWRNDGTTLYLLLTALNDPEGGWSALRPFQVELATGMPSFANGAKVAAPPARDKSTQAPNSAWVQNEIEYNTRRYTSVGIGASGNITLSAANAGRWTNMTAVGSTATLPSSSSIGDGLVYQIRNQAAGDVNITHPGGNIQQELGNNKATMVLKYNEWVELTSSGTSYWITGRGKLEEVATVSLLGDRVGEVAFFAGDTPPDGFMKRNGAAISRTTYSALFAKIGTTYGAGDGSNTFNLPDDRGLFVRGWSDGADYDPGRVFGSIQEGQNAAHNHKAYTAAAGAHSHTMTFIRERITAGFVMEGGNAVFGDQLSDGTQTLTSSTYPAHVHTVSVHDSGGDEARPVNRAYLPCIKY